ncbi:MAG TPA: hypothetical protein VHG27_00200 [Xanthobacteraceae bacterium]|nr:hypothetical protein [Xanthobacteraceae bacterium]
MRGGKRGRRCGAGLVIALALGAACGTAALGTVGMLLWPRWPAAAASTDAPTLPITIAGVGFNVPPAAIRFPPQRRPGEQPRLDLAFRWPQLTPPEAAGNKPAPSLDSEPIDQVFISIASPQGALPLGERVRTIYPRYMAPAGFLSPEGLSGVSFRDGTPYQGEDLLFDTDRAERFLVRCTRPVGAIPGTCLMERQVERAELTVRFPRAWLVDWPHLADRLEHLLQRLQQRS